MKYFQQTLLNAVRKYPEFFILFTVSLIFLLPVLTGGFFLSHDSVTHVARTASYEKALSDGQLPPRWAEQANYGYGSPFMILFYPLASYLMIPLHLAGLSLESSYLVFNIIVFLLTSVGFYLWMRQLFPKAVALAAAIFYTALPYHFLIFYVRGAPGEALAFALLPFLFYCIEKISKKFSFSLILILGMLYAALMLSHNGISLIFTPIFLIYSFLRQKRAVLSVFSAIGMGLLLSAHFWLPALEEAKYTNFLYYFGNMYKEHFLYGLTPIFSPWGFGPDVNKPGGLSAQVGIPATIIFLFGVWMFLTSLRRRAQRETRTLLGFWLVLFLLGIFLSVPLSSFVWERSDFLKRFQFPWRFMALSAFTATAISPYIFERLKHRKMLSIVTILLILSSLPFVKVQKHINLGDGYYRAYSGAMHHHNEATTIWSAGDPGKKAKAQFELIEGRATIHPLVKKSNMHAFAIKADSDVKVVDNTVFYPGWLVWVDGNIVPVEFQDPRYRGIITFSVPKGLHKVEVRFIEPRNRKIANLLSLGGLGFVAASGAVSVMRGMSKRK